MKKIFTRIASVSFVALLCCCFGNLNAQILDEPANWPNPDWTLDGTYTGAGLAADPTVDSNFSFDDDVAGSGSVDNIFAISPVIDLTPAHDGGEYFIAINGDYVYNFGAFQGTESLELQYYDADADSWSTWYEFTEDDENDSGFSGPFCPLPSSALDITPLNIENFSATQLSGFQYRFAYDDGGGWQYGFCFNSPTLTSSDFVIIEGCTDSNAINFDDQANTDDGSCVVPDCEDDPISGTYCYSEDEDGIFAAFENPDGGSVAIEFLAGTIEECCDEIIIYDSGDGTGDILYQGTGNLSGIIVESTGSEISLVMVSDGSVSCDSGSQDQFEYNVYCGASILPGCTDPEAFNYDPLAVIDDGSCVYPPENSDCANATPVTCGDSLSGSTSFSVAGIEGDSAWICNPDINPGNWYVFNGDGQQFTASTCGSSTDTEITVFTIGDCGDIETYECIANNDDDCDLQSSIGFPTTAGVDYYIHVGNYSGAPNDGDYSITFECSEPCEPVPANIDCENATFLLDSLETAGTTACAPPQAQQPDCVGFATTYGVWYEFTATQASYYFDIQNLGETGNIGISVYSAPSGSSDPCGDASEGGDLNCVGPVTGNIVGPLEDFFTVGDTYYINVWSQGTEGTTDFTINGWAMIEGCTDPAAENYDPNANWDDGSCTPPDGFVPANDTCEAALPIVCGETLEGSVLGATATDAPTGCITTGAGVWYTVTGDDQLYTASLCGSDADTRVSVYSGTCGDLTCEGSNAGDVDPFEDCGFEFQDDGYIEWIGTAGENYYIYVESQNSSSAFDLTLECEEVIEGCSDPIASNYNPDANVEGDCEYIYELCGESFSFCYENNETRVLTFEPENPGDVVSITFNQGTLESCCDDLLIYDGATTGAEEIGNVTGDLTGLTFESTGGPLTLWVDSDISVSCSSGSHTSMEFDITCVPAGCTEPVACNYDPEAEIDNGSCEFDSCQGCTYPDAENYDDTAIIDDGSCMFECNSTCPEDLTDDGIVQTDDLLQFLGAYGATCPTVN